MDGKRFVMIMVIVLVLIGGFFIAFMQLLSSIGKI